jgi:hypothetical protein
MLLPLILAAVTSISYPPQDCVKEQSVDSPNHSFSVETWRKGTLQGAEGSDALCLWIVTPGKKTAELLVPPGVLTPLYEPEVHISPDEHWILWEEKLYHPADAYGLFERVADIHFREAGPPLFSEQAWQFMSRQTHHPFKTDGADHIMRVSEWPVPGDRVRHLALSGGGALTPVAAPNDHSLAISLYGDDGQTSVDLWYCFYDLQRHRFYLDATLRKHNKGLVMQSHGR